MKILFLILLLLNLGLVAWHYWIVPQPEQSRALESGVPRLRLWQPADNRAPAPSVTAPTQVPVPATHRPPATAETVSLRNTGGTPSCAEFGPFDDSDAASRAAAVLKARGIAVIVTTRTKAVQSGYWVYFPPFATYDAAKAMETKLRRRGIKDVFIVGDGEQRNAISLGVFSDSARAARRRDALRKLGFKPKLGRRLRDEDRYWLRATAAAGEVLPQAASLATAGTLTRRTLACVTQ
jgi:hypothetical protein